MEEVKRSYDKLLLEYEINSRGMTVDEFCSAIGIGRSTYQNWAIGVGDWTRAHIEKTAKVLELTPAKIIKIFFPSCVP